MSSQRTEAPPEGLDEVLEDVTREVLRAQPDDIVSFAAEHLRGRLNERIEKENATNPPAEISAPAVIEAPAPVIEMPVVDAPVVAIAEPVISIADNGSSNQPTNSAMDPSPKPAAADTGFSLAPPPPRRGRRVSVSAESMSPAQILGGDTEKKVVHPKSPEQASRIHAIVKSNFLFSALDEEQLTEVVDSMFEKQVTKGEDIIKQGDDGDFFYVVQSGEFDIFVQQPGQEPQNVGRVEATGSFGELALMYNSPRAATINCISDAVLWAMDRVTFRRILMDTTSKKRRMYEAFLEEIKILSCIESYERVKIADGLESSAYEDGENIITQGEVGERFYLIEKGTCTIVVDDHEVGSLKKGDYFGELALLFSQPRKATIKAKGSVKVAYLDVDAFNRMLGPCSEIMKRNASVYEEQVTEAKSKSAS